MIARKKRDVKKKYAKNKLIKKSIFWITLILIVFLIWNSLFSGSNWEKKSKLVLVRAKTTDSVDLLIFDPSNSEVVEFGIPESTEVEVVGNLGIRKIGKLWDLSVDENKEGLLLRNTVEKNFLLPVDGWIGPDTNPISANYFDKIKFILIGNNTNLNLRDRLKIIIFLLKNPKSDVRQNFKDFSFLKEGIGEDGRQNYQINGEITERIRSYFSEKYFFENNYKIMIKRGPENSYLSEKVGKIIEILGAKPAYSTYNSDLEIEGCIIYTKDLYLSTKLTNIFNCKLMDKKEGVFDAVIYIGSGLEKEF